MRLHLEISLQWSVSSLVAYETEQPGTSGFKRWNFVQGDCHYMFSSVAVSLYSVTDYSWLIAINSSWSGKIIAVKLYIASCFAESLQPTTLFHKSLSWLSTPVNFQLPTAFHIFNYWHNKVTRPLCIVIIEIWCREYGIQNNLVSPRKW